MPKVINRVTGEVVEEGPYGGAAEEEFVAGAQERVKENPNLVVRYNYGGILNRAPNGGYRSTVHHSGGGGAARKDSTRFYVVSADK